MTIIEFGEDEDFDRDRDEGGTVDDNLGDHTGDSTQQMGYTYGSLTRGLVAYYPMEEGQGQVLHDGALDNLGQINGAAWNGSGQVGADSLSFDGTDDNVTFTLPTSGFLNGTYSVWASGGSGSDEFVIAADNGAGPHISTDGADAYRTRMRTTGTASDLGMSFSATHGEYQHFGYVWRYDADSDETTQIIYLNGTEVSRRTDAGKMEEVESAGVGGLGTMAIGDNDDGNGSNSYPGTIDDVRVYDRALSSTEISALASKTTSDGRLLEEADVPTQSDNGVSRYEFENDVTDSWGSNDGTDNTSAGFVDGVFGQAKDFDGTDDLVNVGPVIDYSGNVDFTVAAWFFVDSDVNSSTNQGTIAGTDQDAGWYIRRAAGGTGPEGAIVFKLDDGTNSTLFSTTETYDGEWAFACLVNDDSTLKGYINGSLVGSSSHSVGDMDDDTDIGFRTGGVAPYWDGSIDDVRIYSQALSPSEVETLYNKGAYRLPRGDTV